MSLFKKTTVLISAFVLLFFLRLFLQNTKHMSTPKSDQNKQIELINDALQKSNFKSINNITINNIQKFFQFQSKNDEKISTIILDLEKDPYLQITTLQKAFKIAKINNKYIKFVNLSIRHPYATLKNY
ncbi:hypothetical protein KJ895_03830 [Patescibacteria group bacterium]|nr:hypothetical protein [Patescibacteria group bacterium]MCG2701732.1 hypothetical protein [Candidatus Parcubacteria bacterium]